MYCNMVDSIFDFKMDHPDAAPVNVKMLEPSRKYFPLDIKTRVLQIFEIQICSSALDLHFLFS